MGDGERTGLGDLDGMWIHKIRICSAETIVDL